MGQDVKIECGIILNREIEMVTSKSGEIELEHRNRNHII